MQCLFLTRARALVPGSPKAPASPRCDHKLLRSVAPHWKGQPSMCPTVCAAHHGQLADWAHQHPTARLLKPLELHHPGAHELPQFAMSEPHPSLFSVDGHAHATPVSAAAAGAAEAMPALSSAATASTSEDATGSGWHHPFPENPKRWKVDEDAWYVPPEGWMGSTA